MERLGNTTFDFNFTLYEETLQEAKSLKGRKVSQKTDIPVKIVKQNIHIASGVKQEPSWLTFLRHLTALMVIC